MLKAVIFDMDGLMIDTEKLLQRFWSEAANFYGYPMTYDDVLGIRSLSSKYAIPHLKALFGEDFDYWSVRSKRIEMMNKYIAENGIEKKQGLDEILDYLDTTSFKKAVCTATDGDRTKMYLTSINVYHRFDYHICGNMLKNGKPAPDIYLMACEKLGLKPCECMALEDSPNGIKSAYDAGLSAVMIPDLSQPDDETSLLLSACCKSLADVIEVIKSQI